MTRDIAIQTASAYFDNGGFVRDLGRRVTFRTASEAEDSVGVLSDFLEQELRPELASLGFEVRAFANPVAGCGPYLIAERIENEALPTVLLYGHGDVIQGQDASWQPGLSPWELKVVGDKIYGRGTADNKGQLTVNLGALRAAMEARQNKLGFNTRIIVETAEERGSPGLNTFCAVHANELKADLFIASDGPRLNAQTPTLFLGSRGIQNFELTLTLREGAHHSGNWGGLLRNPGTVLASAISTLVDAQGVIKTPLLRPSSIPASVRESISALPIGGNPGDPIVDADWGEPGLSAAERVFAWNTLEVLGMECGNVRKAIGAIPPTAKAVLQLRYVVGTDLDDIEAKLQQHFINAGLPWVKVNASIAMAATRLDPEHPSVIQAARSIQTTTGTKPAILPNLGGTIPNDAFSEVLGLPTVWVPHSYPACSQHAPNEHILGSIAREGLQIMAGLFWDLGEPGGAFFEQKKTCA
ncbi:M20 family metallopeptidase [Variovorax ginsengisoli]|uniref:Acetylornithine deacetylase/succinyl-diaminopimelate desuccinylase-like protein n=1 Tax=Variovorax ginsengisoli TaxID=363844 RepID=A0ABT9SBC0_9BURK|nr:M20 family metallopeptidase [Variovorax ginsengisoli]MDP9901143.1 acetylornithine deacetylase/succinyl-diaminopimelate desuccinylase-like protein [Variovorax ginsengisoli]